MRRSGLKFRTFLVCAFLFSGFHAATLQAQTRQLSIGSADGNPGVSISVPLSLDNGMGVEGGVAGFQVDLDFDPAFLSFVRARVGAGTAAAGGWSVLSSFLGANRVRVLGVSGAGTGLSSGFKEVALVDFTVAAPSPIARVPFPLTNCVLSNELGIGIPCAFSPQPGLLAAFPRFADVIADDTPSFQPGVVRIESGDQVSWKNVGPLETHTTTSGSACAASGLWSSGLLPGGRFTRTFLNPPGPVPYFCTPHCASGQTGEVRITSSIDLTASDTAGVLFLSWTGGDGAYRVLRSPNPRFVGTGQAEFLPDGGTVGTTFTDPVDPGAGGTHFYLVINRN